MALYNPMPPACRAEARLHLGDSPSLEEPEARGLLQNEKEIRGVGWRGVRDSNFQEAFQLTGRRRTPIRRFARGCSSLRGRGCRHGSARDPPIPPQSWRHSGDGIGQASRDDARHEAGGWARWENQGEGERSVALAKANVAVRTRCSAPNFSWARQLR